MIGFLITQSQWSLYPLLNLVNFWALPLWNKVMLCYPSDLTASTIFSWIIHVSPSFRLWKIQKCYLHECILSIMLNTTIYQSMYCMHIVLMEYIQAWIMTTFQIHASFQWAIMIWIMTTFQIHSSVKKNDTYIHASKMTTFEVLIQVSVYMPTVTIITVGLYRP